MTTSITTLISDRRFNGLSSLSLIQLEGTLVAANLLLDAWRTTTLFEFNRSPASYRVEENAICPSQQAL